jgi:hypothetical protein
MGDVISMAGAVLSEILRSDVSGHCPDPVYAWLAKGVAHLGLGMVAGLLGMRMNWALFGLALLALKELAFDLPGDGFALLTWADSAVDVVVVALGYLWAFRVKMGRLGPQVKTGGRG